MKKHLLIYTLLVFAIACKKESSITFTPNNTLAINDTTWTTASITTGKLDSIYNGLYNIPLNVDSFNCSTGGTFLFNDPNHNAVLTFPALSYNNAGGVPVNGTDNIKIELTVLERKGDFIKSMIPTSTGKTILASAYSFYLRLTDQGQEVFLAPNSNFSFQWNNDDPVNALKFYEGLNISNPDSLFSWNYSVNGTIKPNYFAGSPNIKGYQLNSSVTHWNGCLSVLDTMAGTGRLDVILPPNFTNKNTLVFGVFSNSTSVIRLVPDYSARTFFATGIPANALLSAISISLIDNVFYLGIPQPGNYNYNVIKLNPKASSVNEIQTFLNSL
jgi:hypothetical protein